MNQVTLKANRRETGKQVSKRYRREGKVTGVYYLEGVDNIPILVETLAMRPIVFTGQTKIVNLEVEGDEETRECVLKDVAFDPVTDLITHFDLIGIVRGQLFSVDVPILLKGTAIGTTEGGIIQHTIHKITINVLPRNMPSSINVDITDLSIGDSVFVRDLDVPNVEFDLSPDTAVVSCVPPRVIKEDVEEDLEGLEGEGEEGAEEGDTEKTDSE